MANIKQPELAAGSDPQTSVLQEWFFLRQLHRKSPLLCMEKHSAWERVAAERIVNFGGQQREHQSLAR